MDASPSADPHGPRCAWGLAPADLRDYHDTEWGFPVADERRLFEKICLEGFQSGLSWLTILRKRERFRQVFDDFDPERVARYGPADLERLLADPGIVRNRAKIEATIGNARACLDLQAAEGSLGAFVWRFEPTAADLAAHLQVATSPASLALSKELRRRGFRWVGPTTVHAFLQAMGLVNDHEPGCATRPLVQAARQEFRAPGR